MPVYAEKKYATCAHFAEICEKCGNKRNMRQFALFLFVCTFFLSVYVYYVFFVMGGQLRWANAFTGSLPL